MGRRLQTVAAITIMKVLLMVFNVVFWATGITILGVGIWSLSALSTNVSAYIQLGLSDGYYKSASYVFIGTGAAIVIIGSLGCCCTIKGNAKLLYLYSVFLAVVFVAELGAGIVGYKYRNHLKSSFKAGILNAIYNYHNESYPAATDDVLDDMQKNVKCCGAMNYTDYFGTHSGDIPQSCCKSGTKCDSTHTAFVYPEGCYTKVINYMDSNMHIIGGTAVGIAIFQVLGVILSCCLAKHINKAAYERVG